MMIADRIQAVRANIAAAALEVGRDPNEITLVAAYPARQSRAGAPSLLSARAE